MKKNRFSVENVCAIIFVILTVLLTYAPYQGNIKFSNDVYRLILRYIVYFLTAINGFIVLKQLLKEKKVNPISILAIMPILFYFILTKINVYSVGINQLSNIHVVIWIIFCLASNDIKFKSFEYFKKTFAVICSIGVFCYIAYILRLPIIYSVENYYLQTGTVYINYKFAFLQGSLGAPRLCCLFNEPGYLGTVCGLILCSDKLNLKKKFNVIIFIAGVLSFSVAFFLLIFIYMLLNCWKNRKHLVIVVVSAILILFIIPNIHTNVRIIDKTLERFQIVNGSFVAYNRTTEEFDIAFKEVMHNKPLFGMGHGYYEKLDVKLNASYKVFLMDYGIVGCLLMWGTLFACALLYKKYDYSILMYIIIFFINIYQRPRIFNLQYELLLFGGILYLSNQVELARIKKESRAKKKVIQFIHGLNTGGAETLVKEYALKIDKNKFDVTVLCLNHYKNSPYEKILRDNNINVKYVSDNIVLKNKNDFFSRKIKAFHRYMITRKFFLSEDADIIHFHLQVSKYVLLAGISKDTKLFYTMHGDPMRYKKMDKIDYYSLRLLTKVHKTKIICLHHAMEQQVRKMYKTDNTIVLNNGINFEKFDSARSKSSARKELNIPRTAFVIGHTGRFNKVKNHEFIVKVFNKVHKINKNAFLLLIGDGEEKKNIIQLLKKYNLNSSYLILSNRDDIPDLLNVMDCFVFPSLSEGLGISLIEAQKAKLPCIISENVPDSAIISNLVKKEALNNEQKWVKYLLKTKKPKDIKLDDSDWNIDLIVKKLENIYLEVDKKYFMITIDTEADNQWDDTHECSTHNAKFLPRFQELAEKYGFKPTWLTTYEMANNNDFVKYFKNKQDNDLCEIGMHLHAWNTPPEYKLETKTKERSYLIEYPIKIMEEKIKNIDALLINKFGVKPISHRAGRWAMDEDYYKLLGKYGYKSDCSTTPHIDWSNTLGESGLGGSDYSNSSQKPQIINNILEVPMTIRKIHQIQFDRIKSVRSLVGELKRFIVGRKQWMRPDKNLNFSGLKRLVKICSKENEYIMFMIHSSELMPGGSPNFKTKDDIEKLYLIIEKCFSYAKTEGYVGITLRDFYSIKNNLEANNND